jgi:putative ABC transport system permease protein
MRFLSLVLRNLLQRRLRSVLTVSGVATAVAALVALVGIARNYERAQREAYEAGGVDLMVVRAGSIQRISSVLDVQIEPRIGGVPGIVQASAGLMDVVSFPDRDLYGVIVQGLRTNSKTVLSLQMVSGDRVTSGDERSIMLGNLLAQTLDKSAGDSLEVVEGNKFRITGVFRSQHVLDNNSIIMPLEQLQSLMAREGEATFFAVSTARHEREPVERLARQIEALAPGLQALRAREYVDTSIEVRMAKAVAWLTSAIALIIGMIGMFNTMATAVFERTRELAILRAIGWRKGMVIRLILSESFILGAAGAALGTAVALVLTQVLSRMPASQRFVSGGIGVGVVLQGVLLALLLSLVGGLYPAYRAAQANPIEGFRHE